MLTVHHAVITALLMVRCDISSIINSGGYEIMLDGHDA